MAGKRKIAGGLVESPAHDWGIPNWRKSDGYPRASDPISVFVWEFLRRQPSLRATWLEDTESREGYERLNPGKPYWSHVTTGGRRRVTVQGWIAGFDNIWLPRNASPGKSLGVVQPGRLHVEIDCRLPLEEQVRRVAILAKLEQDTLERNREHAVRRTHSKLRLSSLVTYLRLLDAKEAGASSAQICTVLRIGEDAVKDGFEKAKWLRDEGWSEIQLIKPASRRR